MTQKTYNLIYFGSPAFSAQILESLISNPPIGIKVVGVVTSPDKKVGRHQVLTPSPVAQVATIAHLPVFKPITLDTNNLAHLRLLKPDLFLVAAYGKIIPSDWISTPSIATLNLHFSLLPKYRGALCIQEAIKDQDPETGVTLMHMDEELDHGPIISQLPQTIDTNDNIASLTNKLTVNAIALLKETLPQYLLGQLEPKPQDHNKASYTPSYKTLTHDSAYIPLQKLKTALTSPKTAAALHAQIRSLNPDPGAWTKTTTGQALKILKTKLVDNRLQILTVQLAGKSPLSWDDFTKGNRLW